MYKIYTISHPITREVVWVGQTKYPLKRRLMLHMSITKVNFERNREKTEWMQTISSLGLMPIIEIIEETSDADNALTLETYWTYQFKEWGFSLLNKYFGKDSTYRTRQLFVENGKRNISPKLTEYARQKRKKPVYQLSISGEIIDCFEFITDAGKSLKIDRGDISKCCKNPSKTAGGYKWMYCSPEDYHNYLNSIK